MNNTVLTLAAALLIAAAPAYYAFQAQAEEKPAAPVVEGAMTPDEATAADAAEPAAGEATQADAADESAQ